MHAQPGRRRDRRSDRSFPVGDADYRIVSMHRHRRQGRGLDAATPRRHRPRHVALTPPRSGDDRRPGPERPHPKRGPAGPRRESALAGLKYFYSANVGRILHRPLAIPAKPVSRSPCRQSGRKPPGRSCFAPRASSRSASAPATLRLEAGRPSTGNDMDETISPLDAGLAWTVFDFRTQTATSDGQGRPVCRRRSRCLGLILLDKGRAAPAESLHRPWRRGRPPVATFSPTFENHRLARLPHWVWAPDDIGRVVFRGDKRLKAAVVKASFVRNGKPLV